MLKIDLSGKTAVVTGATGDLGRVMVRTLAGCGASVAISYHNNRAMAEQLLGEIGGKGMVVQADVTKIESIMAMRDAVKAKLGDADIIVNNAVIQIYPWLSVLDMQLEKYQSQFESCVLHNVMMAKAFVPGMVAKRWGRVIGINTECAVQCTPAQSAYAAGKRGMDAVLRVLAREVGQHQITVNQVAPGWMISDRYRDGKMDEDTRKARAGYEAGVPLRRGGTDQDIANTVAFLASDLAGFITGAFIPVDGGNVMVSI